jgi:large subunit ribosomal protein L25
MSNQNYVLKAIKRNEQTKAQLKEIKAEGYIPAVMYGAGKSQSIAIKESDLPKAGHTHLETLHLELEGHSHKVIMREVQTHPLTFKVLHLDFHEIKDSDVVKVHVPVTYSNLTPEQQKIGNLKKEKRTLEIKGRFSHIPKSISVDVTNLNADESIRLHDITLPQDILVKTGRGKNVVLATLSK